MTARLRLLAARAVGFVWVAGTGPDHVATARARATAVAGLVGVSVVMVALGVIHAVGTTSFAPPDETAHVAYALAVGEWRIPHITEYPEQLPIPGMGPGLSVWTANHPPGTYAVMAIPLRLGLAVGAPYAGLLAARMLNVLAVVAAVWVVARIAATLVPHRPRVVLTTAIIFGLTPYFLHVSALAYTDGLALLPTVAMLAVAIDVVVFGPTRRRLWWAVGLAAVCAVARAQSLVAVLIAGVAWGLGELLHGEDAPLDRVRRGVRGAAAMGGAAALAGGWFFIGNIVLYGDPSGSEALFELFDRAPRGEFWTVLFDDATLGYQQLLLWSGVEGLPGGPFYFVIPGEFVQAAERVLLLILITTAVVLGVHWGRSRGQLDRKRVVAWAVVAGWVVTLYALMAAFYAGGGSLHARYQWPAYFGVAIVFAVGLDSWRIPLPRGWAVPLPRGAAVRSVPLGGPLALSVLLWTQPRGWPRALELFGAAGLERPWPDAVAESFAARGLPAADALAGVVIAGVVVGAMVVLGALLVTPQATGPVPAGPRVWLRGRRRAQLMTGPTNDDAGTPSATAAH